ncbi:MAG: CARDB domain-containing protein [Pseudomonadota bacterium]
MTQTLLRLAVTVAALVCAAKAPLAQQNPADVTSYAAKILCGTQPDAKNLQLVHGFYATVVNILNTSGTRLSIDLSVALAHPPVPPAAGAVVPIGIVELDDGEAAAVDCADIEALGFPFGLPDHYIDGFVVIKTNGALSVQAVYTAAPLIKKDCCKMWPGPVASIDVEGVAPVSAPATARERADLIPEQPVLDQDPLGAPGTGFCGPQQADGSPPEAVAIIANRGMKDAPASTARFDFGPYGQEDRPVPALAPDKTHDITAPIPRQCFGSGRLNTCAFDVIADSAMTVPESLETNNTRRGHCLRSARE